jgi:2-C-methyl-D-erythritol 4-phosphate cytidylyltransferase/2-C-methyl-D-erythritol 2,4-cyclodiphosphate synthase
VPTCTALIVAGGRGSRFGGPLPKQYAVLAGQPVLRRTLEVFRATPGIDRIQVVVASADDDLYRAAVEGMDLPPPVAPAGNNLS